MVTGIDDEVAQTTVLAINTLLKSKAFNPMHLSLLRQGKYCRGQCLLSDIDGDVKGLITVGVNPVFTCLKEQLWEKQLKILNFLLHLVQK